MKIFKQILIVIGIILYANYIIHLPMCVNDYIHKDSDTYSSQHMGSQSIIKRNAAEQIQHIPVFVSFAIRLRKDYIFAITNIFFAIVNIPVYLWQFARANINPCVLFHWICEKYDKNKCSNAYFLLSRHIL